MAPMASGALTGHGIPAPPDFHVPSAWRSLELAATAASRLPLSILCRFQSSIWPIVLVLLALTLIGHLALTLEGYWLSERPPTGPDTHHPIQEAPFLPPSSASVEALASLRGIGPLKLRISLRHFGETSIDPQNPVPCKDRETGVQVSMSDPKVLRIVQKKTFSCASRFPSWFGFRIGSMDSGESMVIKHHINIQNLDRGCT